MADPQKKNEKLRGSSHEKPEEQSQGVVGKLLDALKLAMSPSERSQLQDQLAHQKGNDSEKNPFEKAENLNVFSHATLIKFCIFAATMLMGKGDPSALANLTQEIKAQQAAKQNLSLTEAQHMLQIAENGNLAESIIQNVKRITTGLIKKYIPSHCGDWAKYIYEKSGAKAKRVWPDSNQLQMVGGRSKQVHAMKKGNLPEGENEALELVHPGDWVYYYNKNPFGKGTDWEGQHSSIFLGWIDKSRRIAKMASGSAGVAGREQKINLAKSPITRIHKPQVA